MKLPGDPWNIIIDEVVSMELHGTFPWNYIENVLILHGKYKWRNFHGSWGPNPPWNSMENFPFFTRDSTMSIDFFAVLQIFSFRESGENQIEKADDVLQKVEQILNDF